jgi:hypothetical protein
MDHARMAERKPSALRKQPPYKWVVGLSAYFAVGTVLYGGLPDDVAAYFMYVLFGTALIACAVAFVYYSTREQE